MYIHAVFKRLLKVFLSKINVHMCVTLNITYLIHEFTLSQMQRILTSNEE